MALYREAATLADLALVDPEKARDARDRLVKFVKTYPTGRHIIPAREDLARIQLSTGDFTGAEATIAELAKLPKAGDRAAVLHARVLARQGHHDEAVSELDRLIATFPDKSTPQRARRGWPRERAWWA